MARGRKHDPAGLADDDLLELVGSGNEPAFGVLYDRHATVAFSLALRLLGNRAAAEDLVQEAFLSIWRGASAYSPERGSVRTWVLSIVHHRGVDRLRSQAVAVRRDEAMRTEAIVSEEYNDLTSDEAISRVQADVVRHALDQLSPDQSQVLRLAYFGGFTHHEIAQMLELPLGTVKSRLRLALERLRQSLAGVEGAVT
ncbi:MAG TPA: sigma-70 family RNA polymerase sigma factor [Miltoncostaeales bacterium]|nr:sigma-70 family RNA polymerase sigma factor [Miltoncostaeales bacterium]